MRERDKDLGMKLSNCPAYDGGGFVSYGYCERMCVCNSVMMCVMVILNV